MATRVTFSSLGIPVVSDPETQTNPQYTESKQDEQQAASSSPHRTGKVVTRFQADGEGGSTFERVGEATPRDLPAAPATVKSVRSHTGAVLSLATAEASSIVDLGPGLGDSSAANWVALGVLEPLPGKGYRLVQGAVPGANIDQALAPDTAKDADQNEPVTDADLRGVRGTSDESDALVNTLSTQAPSVLDSVLEQIARGQAPDFTEGARMLQDEGLQARGDAMHADFLKSGQDILRAQGVEEQYFAAFETWAIANEPGRVQDAIRSLVTKHEPNGIVQLARQFKKTLGTEVGKMKADQSKAASYTDEQILGATFGQGVRAVRGDFGGVVMEIAGKGRFKFDDAVRLGYIRVTSR